LAADSQPWCASSIEFALTMSEKHLTEVKRIVSQFGPTAILARVNAAPELG
jgi:hypothetical protein